MANHSDSKPVPIDRIFDRLKAMYGTKFLDLWAHIDPDVMQRMWASALSNFSAETLKAALAHLLRHNPFPPTLPEFVNLCDRQRASTLPVHQPLPTLPGPDLSAATLAKQREVLNAAKTLNHGPRGRQWAYDCLERHRAGTYTLTPQEREIADEAVRTDPNRGTREQRLAA